MPPNDSPNTFSKSLLAVLLMGITIGLCTIDCYYLHYPYPEERFSLKKRMHQILGPATSEFGVRIIDPLTGFNFGYNSHKKFSGASAVKTAVLAAYAYNSQKNPQLLDSKLEVTNEFFSVIDGSPFKVPAERAKKYKAYKYLNKEVTIRFLCRDMIGPSSNLSANILINYLSPFSINERMKALNLYPGIDIPRSYFDMPAFDKGLHISATADALARLYMTIMDRNIFNDTSRNFMLRMLRATKHRGQIPGLLPKSVKGRVAQKAGFNSLIAIDAGLVFPETRSAQPYVLAMMLTGFPNRSEAEMAMAEFSLAVYEHIEDLRQSALRRDVVGDP